MKDKQVTKDELDAFVAAYPRPLVKDVTGICEPPMLSYNDFTLGDWPASVVAKVQLWNGDFGESNRYFIRELDGAAVGEPAPGEPSPS